MSSAQLRVAASVVCMVAVWAAHADAGFLLSFGSTSAPRPTTPRPTLPGGYDPVCRDNINDCKNYGSDSCRGVYLTWAQKNCEATCGFCRPLPTNPPPCVDLMNNCKDFEDTMCTDMSYRPWAEKNCRKYCRLCTASQLQQIVTTRATMRPPSQCVDKVDCALYGQDACSLDKYGTWGQENCALFCGICRGVPTPPALCVDKSPNCASYQQDLCSNTDFDSFVASNCLKFCRKC